MPFVGTPVGTFEVELEVEVGLIEVADIEGRVIGIDTDGLIDSELGKGVVLTVENDVGVGGTTGRDVGIVAGLETGFTGAAVFSKQVQALDKRDAGTPARFFGTCSVGVLRYIGQNAAASLAKRSKARRLLSS